MLMPEHLLQRAHVNAVLQHECCRCVPQFMRGILTGVQTRAHQVFLDHDLYGVTADARASVGEEHRRRAWWRNLFTDRQIAVERLAAGIIEIDHALLAAFAEDAQTVTVIVLQIQTDKFRNTQPAVEKNT